MKKNLIITLIASLLLLTLIPPAQAAEAQINNITDTVGLLTEEEWETLEQQARNLTEMYDFGIYAIVVEDYEEYVYGDINDAAELFFEEYSLGCGSGNNGILLLLSMAERDYSLIVDGDYGEYAFTDYGREEMTEFFLDDFGDDDWYGGFSEYLEWCSKYLETAENGEPFSKDNPPMDAAGRSKAILTGIAAVLLVPLVVAGIVILVLGSKMKSVAMATQAASYIKGNLMLTESRDRYTHTTQTKQKVKSESSGSKSSGNATSGKF